MQENILSLPEYFCILQKNHQYFRLRDISILSFRNKNRQDYENEKSVSYLKHAIFSKREKHFLKKSFAYTTETSMI